MKLLRRLFSINRPSIFLIVLPYLIFYWKDIHHSVYYSNAQMFLFLLIVLILEGLVLELYEADVVWIKWGLVVLLTEWIVFWYGFQITTLIEKFQEYRFNHQAVRGRVVLLVSTIFILLFEFRNLFYRSKWYNFKNSFLIVFSFTISIFSIYNSGKTEEKEINTFKSQIIPIHQKKGIDKPIILIITDEYNSPTGLVQYFKDSSLFEFSNTLQKKGWITRNNSYSYNTSTIHSLSSLFNFNLSMDSNYNHMSVDDIGSEKLLKNALGDSLKKKDITIINFGIFDIGKSCPLTRLYYYPKSFREELLKNTVLPNLFNNTGGLSKEGLKTSYYPMEKHNKLIFTKLSDTVQSINKKNFFAYVHLFMPHGPMQFLPDFKLKDPNPNNYLLYWKFTNKKIQPLLDILSHENKYKIILTGDHGYRGSSSINPHYTFTAFFGFDKEDIDKIKSVQDLGSLINGNF